MIVNVHSVCVCAFACVYFDMDVCAHLNGVSMHECVTITYICVHPMFVDMQEWMCMCVCASVWDWDRGLQVF